MEAFNSSSRQFGQFIDTLNLAVEKIFFYIKPGVIKNCSVTKSYSM